MFDIVLCTINAKWIHPSLALRLLKANLPPEFSETRCTILEFALRQPLAEKINAVLAENPCILALSVSIWNHKATLELLCALEAEWAGSKKPAVILGGPELTPLPPGAEIFRHADFVIRGEGELVFAELCADILENPKPAKEKYGRFIEGGQADTDKIRSAYDLYTKEDLEHKLVYVESSRGCLFNCAFCQSAAVSAVREFPLKPFLDDLDRLLQRCPHKTKTVKFLDRSFNIHPDRALEILEFCLEKIAARGKANKSAFQFHFEMVPSIFPAELGETLARFPPETLRLEIGIQSLNSKTNALINRTCNPEKDLEVLQFLAEKTSAILHVDLIAGLPGEDIESFANGFDKLWITLSGIKNNTETKRSPASLLTFPFEIQLGILKCLPGTPVCDMAKNGRYILNRNKEPPYEVIETDCMPACDLDKLKNFARFWELLVNRRPFPQLLEQLVPPGSPVFWLFMDLSQKLLVRFGRNWGIDKKELEEEIVLN